ncbi:uncharacterized protein N7511_008483 [Penicillium nucicola]|uniref:uncharacterized protein n=1 Tax=Penicillium nucicola TaxID=1850975 RepID=UPI002544FED2|nr:uncharacterized protein N7511_008483 [Penicillium nucicola]KAJ5751518.1 hypothetical protein N7511_008483 [Penicillium nucicola]
MKIHLITAVLAGSATSARAAVDFRHDHKRHSHGLLSNLDKLKTQSVADISLKSPKPSAAPLPHDSDSISRISLREDDSCFDPADFNSRHDYTSSHYMVGQTTSAPTSQSTSRNTNPSSITGKDQYGMTYTPYTQTGGCKSADEVAADIEKIKTAGFNCVRVYSTDCSALSHIGEACEQEGLQIILGIYIDQAGTSAAEQQVQDIAKWAKWNRVKLIVVGNEAIQNGYCDASALAEFIKNAMATFRASGYRGEVTTAEPVNVWQNYGLSNLCGVVDLVGANIHPFFNADVAAAKAGQFVSSQISLLEEICDNLEVVNLETGWPNAGDQNGAAVPGITEQNTAVKAIAEAVGSNSVFFSWTNDLWKSPGDFDVEQHWGCAAVFQQ